MTQHRESFGNPKLRGFLDCINNVNYKLTFLKRIRNYITTDLATLIYKGTILPLIEYADFVFEYGIKYVNKKIQSLQNQGLFIVFNQHVMTRKSPLRFYIEKQK